MEAILAESGMDIHLHRLIVAAEYACKTIPEGDYRTVENTIGSGDIVASNDRIPGIAPEHIRGPLGSIFPGNFSFVSHRLENNKIFWLSLI
jgi:hypothetical protein